MSYSGSGNKEGKARNILAGILAGLCLAGAARSARAGQEASLLPLEHTPLVVFQRGDSLDIRVRVKGRADAVRFYYRTPDLEAFQVRPMEPVGEVIYAYALDASTLSGLDFEYYIAASIDGAAITLPAGAPGETFRVKGQSQTALPAVPTVVPEAERRAEKFKLPIDINASVRRPIHQGGDSSGSEMVGDGNFRAAWNFRKNAFGLGLDSNLAYQGRPPAGGQTVNLTNMRLALTQGNHSLAAGDLNVQETEFTAAGLGRRGVEYSYAGRIASVHIFDVGSQQVQGFSGFGIPKADLSIYGGSVAGRFFKQRLSLKFVYIAGKDDPRQSANTGTYWGRVAREGQVLAFVPEALLFSNKLTLQGEYAQSRYDGNLDDENGAATDSAWRIGANAMWGKFQFQSAYRRIGRSFNPIGHAYFTGDRLSYNAGVSATLGKLTLNGNFLESRDNVEDNPNQATTANYNISLTMNWMMTDRMSINFNAQRNSQDTSLGSSQAVGLQDNRNLQFGGAINWNLGRTGSLVFNLINIRQASVSSPDREMRNITANLSGSFRFGNRLSFTPTIGYGSVFIPAQDQRQTMFNSFLTAEVWIAPQLLSVAATGSYSRTDSGAAGLSKLFNLGWNLNFNIQKWIPWIRVGNAVLSLRGTYNRSDTPGAIRSFSSWLGQFDFSF